jgi:hypothetical protein
MTGYLSGNRNKTGSPGYRSAATGTGYGFLARDITALEVNDRGWGNLPPWGYSRNNADPFKVTTELSGLGCAQCGSECKCKGAGVSGLGCGGGCAIGLSGLAKRRYGLSGMEDAATIAANMYIHAIQAAMSDTVAVPWYTEADKQLARVEDQNTREAISSYAESARNAIKYIVDYGNSEGAEAEVRAGVYSTIARLQAVVASGTDAVTAAGDVTTDVDPNEAKKDAESTSWLQDFAMSDAGAGVIKTGAFTAGVTGINKEAILKEGKRSDIDVGSLVKAGEKFGSIGKIGLIAAAAGAGFIVAKKLGIL